MKVPADAHDTPLHALIAQASGIVKSMRKLTRSTWTDAREQARSLIYTLDLSYPEQSTIQQILGLVRQLASDESTKLEDFRHRANELMQESFDGAGHARQRRTPVSSRDVDAWILDMFRATESAIPRETLVEDFLLRFKSERRIQNESSHLGPWLFMFEAITEQGKMTGIKPIKGCGLHEDAFISHCNAYLPQWQNDPFLPHVFQEQRDIELWYALSFQGSPLFDNLLDIRRHMKGESDYWVNAVSLPGDARHESRAVFILYRNNGDPIFPEPPSGSRQDMRLLTVLGLAWRQLEHQVGALARLSEADRRDLINLIAPGLLHHEIGFNMRTAYGQAFEQFNLLKRIAAETGREDIELAARYAHGIAGLVHKLYSITDAFNNLDKRGQIEECTLDKVFTDIKLLLHHRLGHANTQLDWDQATFSAQTIRTDIVLLSQAFINIINNALNALSEADTQPPRHIKVYMEPTDTRRLMVCLTNNGPPIPSSDARDIFRRGFTTRSQGHGQGLYLSRLVSRYLGGELNLMEHKDLPESFNTGFRLAFYRTLSTDYGVGRVSD